MVFNWDGKIGTLPLRAFVANEIRSRDVEFRRLVQGTWPVSLLLDSVTLSSVGRDIGGIVP